MPITPIILKSRIAQELETVNDARVRGHVRSLLVEPEAILRDWDYGKPNEKHVCWAVLNHNQSNTGIAYCEDGFGPDAPWGLVNLSGNEAMSMGMDSGWFRMFLDAYFDSLAATELPIWRIFKTNPQMGRIPISGEQEWDAVWAQIKALRAEDSESIYLCDHSIEYGKTMNGRGHK